VLLNMDGRMQHILYTHDDFFKDIFSAPEQAADLLRFALPKDALESLDLERMEPYPDSFTLVLTTAHPSIAALARDLAHGLYTRGFTMGQSDYTR